jgi:hypothetical protein
MSGTFKLFKSFKSFKPFRISAPPASSLSPHAYQLPVAYCIS